MFARYCACRNVVHKHDNKPFFWMVQVLNTQMQAGCLPQQLCSLPAWHNQLLPW